MEHIYHVVVLNGENKSLVEFRNYNEFKSYCQDKLNIDFNKFFLYYKDKEGDNQIVSSQFDFDNFIYFLNNRNEKEYIQMFIKEKIGILINNNNDYNNSDNNNNDNNNNDDNNNNSDNNNNDNNNNDDKNNDDNNNNTNNQIIDNVIDSFNNNDNNSKDNNEENNDYNNNNSENKNNGFPDIENDFLELKKIKMTEKTNFMNNPNKDSINDLALKPTNSVSTLADLLNLMNEKHPNMNEFIKILNLLFKRRIFNILKTLKKKMSLTEEIYNSLNKNLLKEKPINDKFFDSSLNLLTKTIDEKIQFESSIIKNSFLKSMYKTITLDIHRDIKCDNCQIKPILGIRFKCLECENYNLCNNCMLLNDENNFHPHDSFKKIRREVIQNENLYSYVCENNDLTFIYNKKKIQKNSNGSLIIDNIYIRNNGIQNWPQESFFKYDKIKSTIKCNDVSLPSLKVNTTKIIKFEFINIDLVPIGEYECYVNFICERKIYNEPLIIKIILK